MMKKKWYYLTGLMSLHVACEQPVEKIRGIPTEARVEAEALRVEQLEKNLK